MLIEPYYHKIPEVEEFVFFKVDGAKVVMDQDINPKDSSTGVYSLSLINEEQQEAIRVCFSETIFRVQKASYMQFLDKAYVRLGINSHDEKVKEWKCFLEIYNFTKGSHKPRESKNADYCIHLIKRCFEFSHKEADEKAEKALQKASRESEQELVKRQFKYVNASGKMVRNTIPERCRSISSIKNFDVQEVNENRVPSPDRVSPLLRHVLTKALSNKFRLALKSGNSQSS